MPGRARWRGGGRARQRPGYWLASAGRVICAAMRVHARARMRVLCTSAACTVMHCMRAPPEKQRGCRTQRPGVLPSAGRVICAAMRVHARVRMCIARCAACTTEKSNGPAAGSPLHAHQCLEGCSIHRTGSHRALRPLVSAAAPAAAGRQTRCPSASIRAETARC